MAVTAIVDGGIATTTASTATGTKALIPNDTGIVLLLTIPAQPNTSY